MKGLRKRSEFTEGELAKNTLVEHVEVHCRELRTGRIQKVIVMGRFADHAEARKRAVSILQNKTNCHWSSIAAKSLGFELKEHEARLIA